MAFASPAEFLAHARTSGALPPDCIDELLVDPSLPDTIDEFLAALKQRGILGSDPIEGSLVSLVSVEGTLPVVAVPHDESGEVFTPLAIPESEGSFVPSPVRRRTDSQMTREKMWTWIAVGAGLWLVGFIILGVWLGGCLEGTPKPKPGRMQKG